MQVYLLSADFRRQIPYLAMRSAQRSILFIKTRMLDGTFHANQMYDLLVRQLSEKEYITEQLKAEKPMEWMRKMNAIRITAAEIVNREIIHT